MQKGFLSAHIRRVQCDQMIRLFFNNWPYAAMKISLIMSQICQSRLSILPNKKWTVKNLPKTCKLFPKWRHFTTSGHTRRVTINVCWKSVRCTQTHFVLNLILRNKLFVNCATPIATFQPSIKKHLFESGRH